MQLLVGGGVSLISSAVTLLLNLYIEKCKKKLTLQQDERQLKRARLDTVYKKLISIINLYPNSSPNDVLKWIEFAPSYSMEGFDSVLMIIDYQIEDYKAQLNNPDINLKRKNDIETQISSREYCKKKICEIRDQYFNAENEYKKFCVSEKVDFDLYAGQDVKNLLVEFEVLIHNVFVSGFKIGDIEDPLNNSIEIIRRQLITSMRNDMGIY